MGENMWKIGEINLKFLTAIMKHRGSLLTHSLETGM